MLVKIAGEVLLLRKSPEDKGELWEFLLPRQTRPLAQHSGAMATESDSPFDQLLKEYSLVFREFDDLTLARWLAQTLGQLQGKVWRSTHPLLGAYRLGAQVGHERQIWFKRLATPPQAYLESPCCRAPTLPLLTRDVRETGLICQH
ncbi:MAG TPA: hypothetical protein VGI88_07380, partial [Verrucomicrobiae bacterium]